MSPLAGCLNKSVSALKNFKADEILELTAVDAVSYIRDGSITAERYASELLKRYRESRVLNAITWIDEGRVMESARAVDVLRSKGQQLGPLAGLPIVVKDNFNTVGFPTTAGTPALKDFYPRANAAVVDVLLSRGAVLLGKTNMHEMAMGVTTSNLAFGVTRNPYDINRVPGGSSGGTGAAIAARLTPAGLGSDTGGSTRIPAAFCGIVGFRPSTGGARKAWPDEGIVPTSHPLDTSGPMGRTVSDVALLNAVVTSTEMPVALPLKGVRIGVPRAFYWEDLDREVATVCDRALATLRDAGVELIDVDFREWAEAADRTFGTLVVMRFLKDFSDFLANDVRTVSLDQVVAGVLDKDVAAGFKYVKANPVSPKQGEEAVKVLRPKLTQQYQQLLQANNISAIVYPTEPILAPPIRAQGDPPGTIEVNGKKLNEAQMCVRNIEFTGAVGAPSLTIPAGLSSVGLPVGLCFETFVGDDTKLMSLGLSLEQTFGRLPPPKRLPDPAGQKSQ